MLFQLSLFAALSFADMNTAAFQPPLPEELCLTKTFSVLTPKVLDEKTRQRTCKGKPVKLTPCAAKKCTAEECRFQCAENDKCNFYTYTNKNICKLYESCTPDKKPLPKGQTGPTYAKVCREFSGTVAMSWGTFQEARWMVDEMAIKAAVESRGGMYISRDAGEDTDKQNADIDYFIEAEVSALIILAHDASKLNLAKAHAARIPVIAYDRLIDDEKTFYVTFDNEKVGELQAQAIFDVVQSGNFVFMKGSETDANAHFVRKGQETVLGDAIKSGDIVNVKDVFTPGWNPALAKQNFEMICNPTSCDVDAVVSSNDGIATAVAEVLKANGKATTPLSGQDADLAALKRVAKGEQTVTVFKDARVLGGNAGHLAVQLAVNFDGLVLYFENCNVYKLTTDTGKKVDTKYLAPVAITKDNLEYVIDAGWASKEDICDGAMEDLSACAAPASV